jgi:hypothetical protein
MAINAIRGVAMRGWILNSKVVIQLCIMMVDGY